MSVNIRVCSFIICFLVGNSLWFLKRKDYFKKMNILNEELCLRKIYINKVYWRVR